jgi:signal transduction histidine kinase
VANGLRAAAPAGEVAVTVDPADRGGRLRCTDSGPGVPSELQGRLFERFAGFAREGSTSSGIGLSLAKELAEANHGTLRWLSKETRTTFELCLPFAEAGANVEPLTVVPRAAAAAPEEANPENTQEHSKGVPYSRPADVPERVPSLLLVDDNADLRSSMRGLLSDEFRITTASCLAEARKALAEGAVPDVVVSDILLPDGNGYDLLLEMRASAELSAVPLLFVSALGEARERARGIDAGADDYLAKPFTATELRARVHAALRRSGLTQSAVRDEREAWSMELHDGPGGSLTRAAMILEQAILTDSFGCFQARDALSSVRSGMEEIRWLIAGGGPSSSTLVALVDRIEHELVFTCCTAALEPHLSVSVPSEPMAVSPVVSHTGRRILREALTNVVKHADARHVWCTLEVDVREQVLVVRVEDDGKGWTSSAPGGSGVSNLQRRASACGGVVRVMPRSPRGTVVEARLALGAKSLARPRSDARSADSPMA